MDGSRRALLLGAVIDGAGRPASSEPRWRQLSGAWARPRLSASFLFIYVRSGRGQYHLVAAMGERWRRLAEAGASQGLGSGPQRQMAPPRAGPRAVPGS